MESYEKFKEELENRLKKYGNSHNIQNITDIDYEIQQQYIPGGDILFKLSLKSFDHVKQESVTVEEISCNHEELILLIVKLKDIERHCERLGKTE